MEKLAYLAGNLTIFPESVRSGEVLQEGEALDFNKAGRMGEKKQL